MEFRTAFTGVRGDWVGKFCSANTNMCWRVVLSLRYLPKVDLCLIPSLPTSSTVEDCEITGVRAPSDFQLF